MFNYFRMVGMQYPMNLFFSKSKFLKRNGLKVAIGISVYPIIPVGCVAKCVVFFQFFTEHESSEFFDRTSMKKKYRFNFDKKCF